MLILILPKVALESQGESVWILTGRVRREYFCRRKAYKVIIISCFFNSQVELILKSPFLLAYINSIRFVIIYFVLASFYEKVHVSVDF